LNIFYAEGNPIKYLAPQISQLSNLEALGIGKEYLTFLQKNLEGFLGLSRREMNNKYTP